MRTTFRTVISMGLLGLLISCGSDSGSGDSSSADGNTPAQRQDELLPPDGSNIDGIYMAKFETLNPQVNGTVPGSFTVYRKDDRLMFYGRVFAGYPKAWHQQYIHIGSRCPNQNDDTNGDGFIDIVEARQVMGKIVVPLDSDPGSQASGSRFFPLGDLSGSYWYERVTSFKRFFSDLKATDKDPEDEIMKIAPDQGFSFEGKTVIIHGVAESVEFPETVQGYGRWKAFQTLPIACGVFRKVTEEPGDHPDGSGGPIPGPVAPVEEGQDRPADETPTDDGNGPRREGNGTNSSDNDGEFSDGGNSRTRPENREPETETPRRPNTNTDSDDESERPSRRPTRPTPEPTPTPSEPTPREPTPREPENRDEPEVSESETTTERRARRGGRSSLGSGTLTGSNSGRMNLINTNLDWWEDYWHELKGTDRPMAWGDSIGEVHHIN